MKRKKRRSPNPIYHIAHSTAYHTLFIRYKACISTISKINIHYPYSSFIFFPISIIIVIGREIRKRWKKSVILSSLSACMQSICVVILWYFFCCFCIKFSSARCSSVCFFLFFCFALNIKFCIYLAEWGKKKGNDIVHKTVPLLHTFIIFCMLLRCHCNFSLFLYYYISNRKKWMTRKKSFFNAEKRWIKVDNAIVRNDTYRILLRRKKSSKCE